jgi:hypothetical protein
MSKLVELEKLLDGTSGRKVTTDEYSDVRNLLDHFEAENNRRFCEFGSLVESLQVSALLYILHTGCLFIMESGSGTGFWVEICGGTQQNCKLSGDRRNGNSCM